VLDFEAKASFAMPYLYWKLTLKLT